MTSVTGSDESGSWDTGTGMAPGAGAVYCGGGTGFAVYCGSVWLHATATNRQGNNAMLCFHILMVFSLGVTPLVIME